MGSHVVLPGLEAVMNWRGGWGSAEGRRDTSPSECEARHGLITCMILKGLSGGSTVEMARREAGSLVRL